MIFLTDFNICLYSPELAYNLLFDPLALGHLEMFLHLLD